MTKDRGQLDALGREVRGALDAYTVERELAVETARRKFLRAELNESSAAPGRVPIIALATAALVVLAGSALFVGRPRPLAFTADGTSTTTETWIAASAARPVALEFSDGTVLRVEPSSRARVVAVDERGASVALENGALHADVVHTPESAWRVIAGPLTVRVTGTRFALRWSASTEEFSVSVKQGSISVTGPALQRAQPVVAGETLRVFVAEKRFELANGAAAAQTATPSQPPSATAAPSEPPRNAAPQAVASGPSAVSATSEAKPRDDWRELARRGLLRRAFAAAEAADFDVACRTASAAELLQLGDAARLSDRPDRAKQALLGLRARYPSDPRRSAAAFALGKVAFDQTRSYAQAAEWFSTSIREQPSGSLAREAAGRLIEAYRNGGNSGAAERAARDYLDRYPDGPHADVARSVLR
jgi:TolA-binding protein